MGKYEDPPFVNNLLAAARQPRAFALNHMFWYRQDYTIACETAAMAILLRGKQLFLGNEEFENTFERLWDTKGFREAFPGEAALARWTPFASNVFYDFLSVRKPVDDPEHDWVPGDWGHIKNTGVEKPKLGLEGENVIYLGEDRWFGLLDAPQLVRPLVGGWWVEYFYGASSWFEEVKGWNGKAEILPDRMYTGTGLAP